MIDNTKICPYCRENINKNLQQCPYCGEVVGNTENIKIQTCPYCGENISTNSNICPLCHENIEKELNNNILQNRVCIQKTKDTKKQTTKIKYFLLIFTVCCCLFPLCNNSDIKKVQENKQYNVIQTREDIGEISQENFYAENSLDNNDDAKNKKEIQNAKTNIKSKLMRTEQACNQHGDKVQCGLYFNDLYNVLKEYENILSSVFPLETESLTKKTKNIFYGTKFISNIERKTDCEMWASGCITSVDIKDNILGIYHVVYSGEGFWNLKINFNLLYKKFYTFLTNDWQDYLTILNNQQQILGDDDFYIDGSLSPSKMDLALWIINLQNFNKKYPNFVQKQEVQEKIREYTGPLIRDKYSTFKDGSLLPEAKEALVYYLENADETTEEYKCVQAAFYILKKHNFKSSDEFLNYF